MTLKREPSRSRSIQAKETFPCHSRIAHCTHWVGAWTGLTRTSTTLLAPRRQLSVNIDSSSPRTKPNTVLTTEHPRRTPANPRIGRCMTKPRPTRGRRYKICPLFVCLLYYNAAFIIAPILSEKRRLLTRTINYCS